MPSVDLYPFAVYLHILGAFGLFAALMLEWLAITQLRRSTSSAASATWSQALSIARRIGPPSMGLLLVPGVAMALTRWNFPAWPAVALGGMSLMVAVGLLLSRRPTLAVTSVEVRLAIALGIVALMVFKPDLVSSLIVLVATISLGAGASLIAHGGSTPRRGTLEPGIMLAPRNLEAISGEQVPIPDGALLVHLQFRRFAGCPVCNLHLRSFARRHSEIADAGIREVVVFHSTREALLEHAADLPFPVVADPGKQLYTEFGVESLVWALLDPRAWLPIARGVARSALRVLTGRGRVPSLVPAGGRLGLPADFLIANDGRVLAAKYGSHAYDQWSVDQLLTAALPATARKSAAITHLQRGGANP
jgi:peroxiredoxin